MEGVGAQEARAPVRTRPLTPPLSQRACDISATVGISLKSWWLWLATGTKTEAYKKGLLLNSRVVDVSMSYNAIVVTPTFLESLVLQWALKRLHFSEAIGVKDPGIQYERVKKSQP